MSHTPHELHEDFPDMADRITALKSSDAHFARLMDDYHAVNRQIHAAETNVTPVSPAAETDRPTGAGAMATCWVGRCSVPSATSLTA